MSGEAQVPGQTGRGGLAHWQASFLVPRSLCRRPAPHWQRPQAVEKHARPRRREPGLWTGRLPPRMEHSGAPGLEGPAAVGTDLGPFLAARGGALCPFQSLCPLPAAGRRPWRGPEPVLSSTCAPG